MKRKATPSRYAICSTYRIEAEMRVIGFIMIGTAVAMFVIARPRGGKVVPWLRSDSRQWAYGMTVVFLIAIGFVIALFG